MVSWGTRNLLIATILLAALFGGVTGLGASYFAHTAPTPQTRDLYLFAQDLSFTAPSNLSSKKIAHNTSVPREQSRKFDSPGFRGLICGLDNRRAQPSPAQQHSRNLILLYSLFSVLPTTRLLASIPGVFLPSCNGWCLERRGR